MTVFIILLILLVVLIFFCVFTFERAMWLCVDYWSDKQYNLFKIICAGIGLCFLIAIICVALLDSNRYSNKMICRVAILDFAAFVSMALFSQIIHFIAWKKKFSILKKRIKKVLQDNLFEEDESKILNICMNENKEYFSEKQIKKAFKKETASKFRKVR